MPTITRRRRPLLALGLGIALLFELAGRSQPLSLDAGAAGAWQKIQKLQTTASVMHTTAHPDDEHGGMLAMLSRGQGARVALLTLNRGESGDNAIGPELFDGLGLIRTEELSIAGRYYGVDRQYFTSVVDYGFSKRLDEALGKWGRENVLRDVVRVIRIDRPLVIDLAVPGQPARRPRQPRGRRADHAGRIQGRRRSEDVPRADRRGPATLAAAQTLYGWRPRERGLDHHGRYRDLRSGTRRFLPDNRAAWAFRTSVRRTAAASARGPGRRSRTTSASRASSRRRRRRRASSTASTRPSPECIARCGSRRRPGSASCWR